MKMEEIRQRAREKLQGFCRVCRRCDGRACAGEVPGMGGILSGRAFQNNVSALDMYHVNLRTIHQVEKTDTSIKLFSDACYSPDFLEAPFQLGLCVKGQLAGPVPRDGAEADIYAGTAMAWRGAVSLNRAAWKNQNLSVGGENGACRRY